jgi:hypothetical protein
MNEYQGQSNINFDNTGSLPNDVPASTIMVKTFSFKQFIYFHKWTSVFTMHTNRGDRLVFLGRWWGCFRRISRRQESVDSVIWQRTCSVGPTPNWSIPFLSYVCVCVYVCMCICVYVCMDGWMYACIHVCIAAFDTSHRSLVLTYVPFFRSHSKGWKCISYFDWSTAV